MKHFRERGLLLFLLLTSWVLAADSFIEPVTTGIAVGAAFLLSAGFAGYNRVRCTFGECCESAIKLNITGLRTALTDTLYGQPLVKTTVLRLLKRHLSSSNPEKPLALSFHGWTGSGKNFVFRLIASHAYEYGQKSKFIHLFVATVHFPHKYKVAEYQDNLRRWIHGNVSSCEHSMFVFDEMDKMPNGLLDAIKPYLDSYREIDGVDYRKSIFLFLRHCVRDSLANENGTDSRYPSEQHLQNISEGVYACLQQVSRCYEFDKVAKYGMHGREEYYQLIVFDRAQLATKVMRMNFMSMFCDGATDVAVKEQEIMFLSNTAGHRINMRTLEYWKAGRRREDITRKEMEELISLSSFNEDGGLWHSSLIEKNMISAFIPFLPLERRHVKECVKDDMKAKGHNPIRDKLVNQVLDELTYFPKDNKIFSSSGCKRVAQKIDLIMEMDDPFDV